MKTSKTLILNEKMFFNAQNAKIETLKLPVNCGSKKKVFTFDLV